MPGCLYRVALPFDLALPSDQGFIASSAGRRAMIRCMRGEGRSIFSYRDDLAWIGKIDEEPSAFEAIRTVRVSPERERVPIRTVYYGGDSWKDAFSGGVVELALYSVLELGFEVADIEEAQSDTGRRVNDDWVRHVVSKLISIYQEETSETDVHQAAWRHPALAVVDIRYAEDFRWMGPEVEATFSERSVTLNLANRHAIRPFKETLPDAVLERIAERLESDRDPAMHSRLLNEARELALLHDLPELAIVVIGTAFEVYLKTILHRVCSVLDIRELPFHDRYVRAEEAIDEGNVSRDLLTYVRLLGSENVKESREYTLWYRDAYDPRNDIAHGGVRGFDEDSARRAFEATLALMRRVKDALATPTSSRLRNGV